LIQTIVRFLILRVSSKPNVVILDCNEQLKTNWFL